MEPHIEAVLTSSVTLPRYSSQSIRRCACTSCIAQRETNVRLARTSTYPACTGWEINDRSEQKLLIGSAAANDTIHVLPDAIHELQRTSCCLMDRAAERRERNESRSHPNPVVEDRRAVAGARTVADALCDGIDVAFIAQRHCCESRTQRDHYP